ncbi:methyltransferase domain-containing protein [Brasilonema sp. CT11]|nr:methyltransferase domain-containing protein [Brasilonema sp. CT11]
MIKSAKNFFPKSFRERYYISEKNFKKAKFQLVTEASIIAGKIRRVLLPIPLPNLGNCKRNLHLGCGYINHPKFVNIDGLPAPHIHYIRPIDNLSCFKRDTVDLIYASHCLEHFPHAKVPEVLTEWFRVLKQGGILRLSVPDFDLLLDIYKDSGNDINTIITALMGGQDYKYNFHMIAFNKASLSALLKNAGFREVEEWLPGSSELTTFEDHSVCEFLVNGQKYPVSINIQAIK